MLHSLKSEVSVVMATYNRGYIIGEAIQSVLNQTYPYFELYIVDDGSADNTEEVVRTFADERIHYDKLESNHGANYARNIAVKEIQTQYIAFLDSDNLWKKDFLDKQIEKLKADKADIVFARTMLSVEQEKSIFPVNEKQELVGDENLLRLMCFGNVIDLNTVLLKTNCIKEAGYFDEKLKRFQDYDLFLRCMLRGCKTTFNDVILSKNRVQKNSISMKQYLYWDARIHVFEYSADYCRSAGILYDVVYYLINDREHEITPEIEEKILGKLTPSDFVGIFPMIKEKDVYIRYLEERMDRQEKSIKRKKWIVDRNIMPARSKVIIYGYGDVGKDIAEQIDREGYWEISAIIDQRVQSGRWHMWNDISEVLLEGCEYFLITPLNEEQALNIYQNLITQGFDHSRLIMVKDHL